MQPIYLSIKQLSILFRIDYSTLHRIFHEDAERLINFRKLNRYDFIKVVQLHKINSETLNIDLQTDFLNLYETQIILNQELGPMVYTTVLRKAVKGEIPALKFGDTYRVPKTILMKYITENKIRYRKRNITD